MEIFVMDKVFALMILVIVLLASLELIVVSSHQQENQQVNQQIQLTPQLINLVLTEANFVVEMGTV
jgi:CHASE1-domain containing sensor protein